MSDEPKRVSRKVSRPRGAVITLEPARGGDKAFVIVEYDPSMIAGVQIVSKDFREVGDS